MARAVYSGLVGALRVVASVVCVLAISSALSAHDIPVDVAVQAFVKPEGTGLRLLVRVPLKAMRDVNFPLRGPGFLDLSRADPFLDDAARLWISNSVEMYEGDARTAPPRLVAVRVSLPSDRAFVSYDAALTNVFGPHLQEDTEIPWDQAMLDALFEYPIASESVEVLDRADIRKARHPRRDGLAVCAARRCRAGV